MHFMVLNGSPHKEGNTAVMLKEACGVLESLGAEVVFVQVPELMNNLKKPFCLACSDSCSGICYKGTRLEEIFNLMSGSDGMIIGSPVYFCTLSAQMKAFWDKTRRLRKKKALLNTVGAAIVVGGSSYGGQETAIRTIHDIMLCQGMIIVGDGFHETGCGHLGACAQGPVADDSDGLKRVAQLAKRVYQVAEETRGARR